MIDVVTAAQTIAQRLHAEAAAGRLQRVDFDIVRATVAGYLAGSGAAWRAHAIDDLENLTLRKFVEACK